MSIHTRIISGIVIVSAVILLVFLDWAVRDIRPQYLKSLEEPLIDTAFVLASIVERTATERMLVSADLSNAVLAAYAKPLAARIYERVKTNVDVRVYVTDSKGIVVFDSSGGDTGKDYSRWNDVLRTLAGSYGARATRADKKDPNTGMLYIAAPVRRNNAIIGVVSVGKPTGTLTLFMTNTERRIRAGVIITGSVIIILLGLFLYLSVTRPIKRLTAYARSIKDTHRTPLPRLGTDEIGTLGRTLGDMRDALEGRHYVEQFVERFTHEIQSPITAISGAAELLAAGTPPAETKRFLENIRHESQRIRAITDRLLTLASLENRRSLDAVKPVDLSSMLHEIAKSHEPTAIVRGITIDTHVPSMLAVDGDEFLLRQAVANIVQNALDFTPSGGRIVIEAAGVSRDISIVISDTGTGIPSYAVEKIFDKFYSLPRPGTGRKSTGLGLPFVREVAQLHGGRVTAANRASGGTVVTFTLPLEQ
ncbi:MAG: two-component system sensor histidine kinase CreC [Spirochaetota bacterium]